MRRLKHYSQVEAKIDPPEVYTIRVCEWCNEEIERVPVGEDDLLYWCENCHQFEGPTKLIEVKE